MTAGRDVMVLPQLLALCALLACETDTSIPDQAGGTQPPPAESTLFRSDWSTATGTGIDALSDGGKWEDLICAQAVLERSLEVVPGSTAGWTATPNVLQVTYSGDTNCGQVESTVARRGQSYFIRMYIYVQDLNQPTFHSINVNSLGDVQVPLWAAHDVNAGVDYNPKLTLVYPTLGTQYRDWKPRTTIRMGHWYRFEWHVQILDANARTARIWPRIYDAAGQLVHDANSFVPLDPANGTGTLQRYYDMGGAHRFTTLDLARKFGLGYEGVGPATGRKWYAAAVEVRSDDWVGPIRQR